MADEAPTRRCPRCKDVKPLTTANYGTSESEVTGWRWTCKKCEAAASKARRDRLAAARRGQRPLADGPNLAAFDAAPDDAPEQPGECVSDDARRAERAARETATRRASDFEAMKPADFVGEFDTSVGNAAESPADRVERGRAAAEKRQEFNRQMGEFAQDLRDSAEAAAADGDGVIGERMPERHAPYIAALAEQERRFGNRRWARSIAIQAAHEQLAREQMMHVAETYFRDKVTPTGYTCLPRPSTPPKRTVCVLLSDLHLGSELDALDEPQPFQAVQEARRLEYVLRQFVDYKPQYRDQSEALVILNGDVIEGMLLHDLRAGSPLTEQKAIFWHHMRAFLATVSARFPSGRVVCQPGNHGRDKLRHPGRATSSKWDGHEWAMYYALRQMCSGLTNLTWSLPFQAISIVDLYGSKLGVTHADTELKLGDPDTKSRENSHTLDQVNATRIYGCTFDAWCFGHYHKPRYQPRRPRVIWNAALVPPNGYARAAGYLSEPAGQFVWESVPGFPIGDVRFVEVGASQDNDERLGTIIEPFRFKELP